LGDTDEYHVEANMGQNEELWLVWVYYLGKNAYNAFTFGYYEVDANTGEVTKLDEELLTYSDRINGVSLKYPPEAKIQIDETDENIVSVEFQDDACTGTGPYPCAWFVRIYGPYPNPNQKPLEEFIISFLQPTHTSIEEYEVKKVEKISGMETVLVEFDISKELDSMPVNRYFVQRSNDVVEIVTGVYPKENSDGKEYKELVEKIVKSISLQ
jgi:hypothetical protein